jgi:Alpha-L-arabinofuranosidase C-terminus
LHCRGCHVG